MNLKLLIEFFKSKEAVLLALIFALLTQLSHSVIAYALIDAKILKNDTPNILSYIFGILFSLAVSTAIIIFTLRNRKYIAYFFLIVEIFVNLIYSQLQSNYDLYTLISILFLAIIIPVTITAYSHETETEDNKSTIEEMIPYKESLELVKNELMNKLEESTKNKIDRNSDLIMEYKGDGGINKKMNIKLK